jgi:methionine synthase II (cobalamin-independent)
MSKLQTPFRYDFVGSFLRPQALKDAKAAYQVGKISKDELDKVVNEEITKVVAKQKELGFHVITDGEFRRTFWHLDFMWGFEGVAHLLKMSTTTCICGHELCEQEREHIRQLCQREKNRCLLWLYIGPLCNCVIRKYHLL